MVMDDDHFINNFPLVGTEPSNTELPETPFSEKKTHFVTARRFQVYA